MKKKPQPSPTRNRVPLILVVTLGLCTTAAAIWFLRKPTDPRLPPAEARYVPRPKGSVTFNRQIAPIFHSQCATCHRPGQPGPFDLITYADAKKRAKLIGTVTGSGFMPPWLPEAGHETFLDERRLSAEQLGLIQQWIDDDTPEGVAADLPPTPKWPEGWQLGPPDAIAVMPQTYTLPAEGRDVYRHFVIPVSIDKARHVRALEFRADTRVIHHAIVRVDRTRQSRRLDAQDAEPGFGGMETGATAESAGGHFLSWQPGRGPTHLPEGLSWTLQPGSDLVVQMHLQPTGKPEPVRVSIALYFTDIAPTNAPFKIFLNSYALDIPAGSQDFVLEDGYELPVDADLLAVLPHAHYLGKRLEGFATLPDGTRKIFLLIQNWDFNWQSDYRFAQPLALPKGTRVAMRYSYDNSTNNLRNPHQPPVRVKYGLQSTAEMGELWLQILPHNKADFTKLEASYGRRIAGEIITFNRFLLEQNPNNAAAHTQLGKALYVQNKKDEALDHFLRAVRAQPNQDEALYHIGVIALERNQFASAEQAFQDAIKANPEYFKAHNNLGLVYLRQNRLEEAEAHFNAALALNPGDAIAIGNLRAVARARAGTR